MNERMKARITRVMSWIDLTAKLLPLAVFAGLVMWYGGAQFWHTDLGFMITCSIWNVTHLFG